MRRLRPLGLLVALVAGVACRPALAGEEVRVAVAASFAPALRELAEPFYQHTGHRLVISAASTGALYAQIRHGAPYDVFLAADAARPRRLEQEGVAVPGSRFTYARGRLVLWSARAGAVTGPEALQGAAARPIALANPRIAPYGSAALTALERLGLADRLRPRLVYGQDVGQVFQFVATGNAEAGFVALAQVLAAGGAGSWWLVPERLYEPLEQQAVLLRRGGDNPAAHAAVAFLRGEEGRRRIAAAGYGLPEP